MSLPNLNIPDTNSKRIVILGAGFAGLNLAKKLRRTDFQVVLIDRLNFHQFQPLFYQVAMAGLEPSAIAFPIRKVFHHSPNVFVRKAEVQQVLESDNKVITSNGEISYDILVICLGAETNFFGNKQLEEYSFSLKSLGQSLGIRNQIFLDFERSMYEVEYYNRQSFVDFVIVGGGPTGVEMAGSLVELKRYVIAKDYPQLDHDEIDVYLVQSGNRLLPGMREKSSRKAEIYLRKMSVQIILIERRTDYDGQYAYLKCRRKIKTYNQICEASVRCPVVLGLEIIYGEDMRFLTIEQHCRVINT